MWQENYHIIQIEIWMLAKLEYKILIINLAFQKGRKIDFK